MATGKFDQLVENVMSGKSIFAESKSSAKAKYVKTKKITEDVFKKLLDMDNTINKRYVEWMAKMVVEDPKLDLARFSIIPAFEKLSNEQKLTPEQKDFVKFAKLDDMEKVIADVKAAGPTKSYLKTGISNKVKSGNIPAEFSDKVIWKGKNSFVLQPSTKEEGIKFGNKGSSNKWCISSEDASMNQWDNYYYEQAANIYFVVPFKPDEYPADWKKIAVLAYPGGKMEVRDFVNKDITGTPEWEDIITKLGDEDWR
jgi:hypothetical protein